ncbi:ATP-binding cassette domain-containing protein [Dysgonomonas sp. 521]|uniref:ATP-binding cassette domain-containing protein n=1 Tax=Dysgonomonas sp. 521 TaxID=2302932 RepID=UPI0013CFB909|nr:ATP-binding cassette domain-containing protein [Dysgonomonas sp. 521]NDV94740.1 ATP-binding cassette domain-containing protein [Dysgonomonas sp. 521]
MYNIHLKNILPDVFSGTENISSQVWQNDITFKKGETYLIKAESGLGKSSLCSYIYGYRADFSGDILFDEIGVKGIKNKEWDNIRTKHLSLLFQELRLFPELTALENIRLKNNLTRYKTDSDIDSMFGQLGVGDKKNQLIGKMSWGQQQRVAIIRSLCQPFDFLFLDEPVSHLDDNNARIITELVRAEVNAQGAGLIVTSIGKDLPMDYTQTLSL